MIATLRHGLEMTFPSVWVEGEVSNFMAAASGHWYLTLKDANAQIRCVYFRYQRGRTAPPANGQSVLVRGKPGIYPQRGELQLVLDHLEDSGEGALRRAFEALKQKLEAEGLFAAERKRQLPPQPRCVGLISSAQGAALHDVLSTLERRNPLLRVVLYPSAVQGDGAPASLAAALDLANRRAECDLLILTRGGGSMEDLQAFNSEPVARAIAASQLPVISAVGHETDVTIADFAADLRAATPTAAAELVSHDMSRVLEQLRQRQQRLARITEQALSRERRRLLQLGERLQRRDPRRQLELHAQRLDELNGRLAAAARRALGDSRRRLSHGHRALRQTAPASTLRQTRGRVEEVCRRLQRACHLQLRTRRAHLEQLCRRQQGLSPARTLERGYAIAWQDEKVLSDAARYDPAQGLRLQLGRGELEIAAGTTKIGKQ